MTLTKWQLELLRWEFLFEPRAARRAHTSVLLPGETAAARRLQTRHHARAEGGCRGTYASGAEYTYAWGADCSWCHVGHGIERCVECGIFRGSSCGTS